jgi:hypothetical protein
LINKNLEKYLPGYTVSMSGVSVSSGFSSLSIARFDLSKKSRAPGPKLEIKNGELSVSWSPWLLRQGVFRALRQVRLNLGRLDWEDAAFFKLAMYGEASDAANGLPVTIGFSRIRQGKKEAEHVEARGLLTREKFALERMAGSLCGGVFEAAGEVRYAGSSAVAEGRLVFKQIRMEELVKQLEMEKRLDLTGVFSGQVDFLVGPQGLMDIQGQLDSEGGGHLVIIDNGALKQGLGETRAANIVVENLENYDYDIGKVTLGKEDKSFKAVISLEGVSGRRHLEVYWHMEHQSA